MHQCYYGNFKIKYVTIVTKIASQIVFLKGVWVAPITVDVYVIYLDLSLRQGYDRVENIGESSRKFRSLGL